MDAMMKTRRETLENFVAADPNDSFSRYALALELEKGDSSVEAAGALREVIARDPGYVAAYYQLGRILSRLGEIDESRSVYQRGLGAATDAKDQRAVSEIREALDMLE
jgi:tetratricopeptide (TPR) repeat protein